MKTKKLLVGILVIILLAGGGILFYTLSSSKSKSTPTEKNPNIPPSNPNQKLTAPEIEKYLREKRLDLEKYFVFNLGELQPGGSPANWRRASENLANHLTLLTSKYEKKLEQNPHYEIITHPISKRMICFNRDNFSNFDEEYQGEKLDEKIRKGNEKYIIFEKEEDFPAVYFIKVEGRSSGEKQELATDRMIRLRIKHPTTTICDSKEKALEIIKTDPALVGKV